MECDPVARFYGSERFGRRESSDCGGLAGRGSAVSSLANEAPTTVLPGDADSSVQDLTRTVAGDVEDIASNGYDSSNGGASLDADVGRVQADANELNCPQPTNS